MLVKSHFVRNKWEKNTHILYYAYLSKSQGYDLNEYTGLTELVQHFAYWRESAAWHNDI